MHWPTTVFIVPPCMSSPPGGGPRTGPPLLLPQPMRPADPPKATSGRIELIFITSPRGERVDEQRSSPSTAAPASYFRSGGGSHARRIFLELELQRAARD